MNVRENLVWMEENVLMKWTHIGVNLANLVSKEKTAKSVSTIRVILYQGI